MWPYWMAPKKVLATTSNKEVQTIIRVYPHIFETHELHAAVCSDRKCQTSISIGPMFDNKDFYSMLEYIPYEDIQEHSVRIIDLPRKPRLKFDPYGRTLTGSSLYLDDDALSELYVDLKRSLAERAPVARRLFDDKWTQTDVQVQPHLLISDKVAAVSDVVSVQTSKSIDTFLPNNS